jgi:hypothetical protein
MKLSDIRDWLKTLGIGEHFYIGKIDNKQQKAIGVYTQSRAAPAVIAIGGLACTKHNKISAKILIHWNKNADESEQAARSLYSALLERTHFIFNNIKIDYLELENPEPINVGSDDSGVYEWVIDFSIYYERND